MKYIIFKTFFIFLLLICSCVNNNKSVPIELNPKTINLGVLESNNKVKITFHLNNSNAQPLKIVSYAKSCGCTNLKIPKKVINGSSSKEISFWFDPTKVSENFEKSIFLRIETGQILIFKFRGQLSKRLIQKHSKV